MWISLLSCRNRNFKAPWVGFSSLVGLSGLEPPTSRLSGGRSNQLSYKPIFSGLVISFLLKPLVEISGIEPLTPCLQSRCSPSWAIPPYLFRVGPWKLNNKLEIHSDLGYELLSNSFLHRKEVIQPHLPIRLPCYDFTPVANPTFDSALLTVKLLASGITGSHGVTGGVYKARERIHRGMLIRDY